MLVVARRKVANVVLVVFAVDEEDRSRRDRLTNPSGSAVEWLEKSLVPAVITIEVGISPHLRRLGERGPRERAGPGAVSDHSSEAVGLGGGLEQRLAADG